jgi:hypothetical protein
LGDLATPKSVQKLQTALHAKAKAEAGYRFYALYDKISRDGDQPIGVQIIGGFLDDNTTIAFAGLIEREFGGFHPAAGLRLKASAG